MTKYNFQLGFGHDDTTETFIEDVGHIRARILSATPTPEHVEPIGEHVSTCRIVVSKPIKTFQEYDIVEPMKPTLIKTVWIMCKCMDPYQSLEKLLRP